MIYKKIRNPVVSPPPAANFNASENPFEIKRLETSPKAGEKKVAPSPVLQPQESSTTINDRYFLSIIALILIVISTVLIVLYRSVVNQIYRAFLNDNILKLKQREQGSFLHLSLMALYFLFFLNAGFFFYLIAKNFGRLFKSLADTDVLYPWSKWYFYDQALLSTSFRGYFPY